jgi:peptide-methionine (R)-S-oxide reductase
MEGRKRFWNALLALPLLAPVAVSCVVPGIEERGAGLTGAAAAGTAATASANPDTEKTAMSETIDRTDAEWRRILTPEQYYVTRQQGSEPAFSGKYWHNDGQGIYRCVCCGQELFRSDQKYDSGTGWPSFWAPIAEGRLMLVEDRSLGMVRVEARCGRCGAHLGHLFDDGPKPTGQRYCLNSAALDFKAAETAEQAGGKNDLAKRAGGEAETRK